MVNNKKRRRKNVMYPVLLDSCMTPTTRKDSIDFHYPTHGLMDFH